MRDFLAFTLVEMLETAIAEYRQTQDFSVVEDVCVVILKSGAPEKVEEKLRQFSAPKSAFNHTK